MVSHARARPLDQVDLQKTFGEFTVLLPFDGVEAQADLHIQLPGSGCQMLVYIKMRDIEKAGPAVAFSKSAGMTVKTWAAMSPTDTGIQVEDYGTFVHLSCHYVKAVVTPGALTRDDLVAAATPHFDTTVTDLQRIVAVHTNAPFYTVLPWGGLAAFAKSVRDDKKLHDRLNDSEFCSQIAWEAAHACDNKHLRGVSDEVRLKALALGAKVVTTKWGPKPFSRENARAPWTGGEDQTVQQPLLVSA